MNPALVVPVGSRALLVEIKRVGRAETSRGRPAGLDPTSLSWQRGRCGL